MRWCCRWSRAFTTWVALLSWKGFAAAWGGFMGPLVSIAVVVALSGALLRWLRVPGPLVVLAQVVIVGAVVSLVHLRLAPPDR